MHTRYSVSVKSRENIEKITNAAVHHSEGEVERYRKMLDKPLGGYYVYMNRTTSGFTIVELLITIVVIGVLAAIAIVTYNGIQNRAYDTAVKNDLGNLRKLMELRKIELEGRYPRTQAELPDYKLSRGAYDIAANNIYLIVDNTGDRYSIGLRSKSGRGFIGTHEQVYEDVSLVNAGQTASRIGAVWGAPHYIHQCYTATAVPPWYAWCRWTN